MQTIVTECKKICNAFNMHAIHDSFISLVNHILKTTLLGGIFLLLICAKNEYLFTDTGVKKMKWFLSLTRCHFQPRVTEGPEWLEMAQSEK